MSSEAFHVPDDVLTAQLDGEAVLLHMETKNYFRLNATAACIWEGVDAGADQAGLVSRLLRRFEVDRETATMEVDRILRELEERGLLLPDKEKDVDV